MGSTSLVEDSMKVLQHDIIPYRIRYKKSKILLTLKGIMLSCEQKQLVENLFVAGDSSGKEATRLYTGSVTCRSFSYDTT
jgi:hypothetical protein